MEGSAEKTAARANLPAGIWAFVSGWLCAPGVCDGWPADLLLRW
jgi:hypothetical protein